MKQEINFKITGGSTTFYIGHSAAPPQQEITLDDIQLEELEEQPTENHKIVSYQKRISQLKQQICTWDVTTRPGQDFWDGLYRLCEDLERDLDKVL